MKLKNACKTGTLILKDTVNIAKCNLIPLKFFQKSVSKANVSIGRLTTKVDNVLTVLSFPKLNVLPKLLILLLVKNHLYLMAKRISMKLFAPLINALIVKLEQKKVNAKHVTTTHIQCQLAA